MNERERVAKLIAGPRRSFKSVRAALSVTREGRAYRYAEQRARQRLQRLVGFAVAGVENHRRHGRIDQVWFEPPRRMRVAREGEALILCDGHRAWLREPSESIWTSVPPENAERKATLAPLRPDLVLNGLMVEAIDEVRFLGRLSVRAHARHRDSEPRWHDDGGLTPYADDYDLVVDAETGVLLSAVARALGKIIASTEVLEISFDEVLPATLFSPDVADDVRPIEALFDHRLESLTPGETPSRVEFPVWGLDRVPESWTVEAGYWPPLAEWLQPPRITLLYTSPDGAKFVNLLESPVRDHARQGVYSEREPTERGRLIERRGDHYFVSSTPSRGTVIKFNRGGTAIRVEAEGLAEDDLLALAASLRQITAHR